MRILPAALSLLPWLAGTAVFGATPTVDKAKLEAYLRYAEGFAPRVALAIDDPVKTAVDGYYRLVVHLTAGESKQEKVYYLSEDGKQITSGPVWSLNGNPFAETAGQVPIDGPTFGPVTAPITLVVFSDFQCPYCREFASTLRTKMAPAFPTQVRVVFQDFPLDALHPWARRAAENAQCLQQQNSDLFWQFHDWIFQHQGEITSENINERTLTFARDHNAKLPEAQACIDSHITRGQVQKNEEVGRKLGISQTPTFFLNGRTIPGAISWESLQSLINMELTRPSFIPPSELPQPAGPKIPGKS